MAEPFPWRAPEGEPSAAHRVLAYIPDGLAPRRRDDPNPFVAYGERLAWRRFAQVHGWSGDQCDDLTRSLDAAVSAVDGRGFRAGMFGRSGRLSKALGFDAAGGVWVKDETTQVSGSHKGRHLVTILLQLQAAEQLGLAPWRSPQGRAPLAIASCGNAALAAATLAAAASWPIDVFVPPDAPASVLARLGQLGARITVCPRRDDDPPGDPCVLRFREAVAAGSVPFSVQGPENPLCLDGGRTLGWELADDASAAGIAFDRVFVQVGGGALAASVGSALLDTPPAPRVHPVQTEGCAPLARAWQLAGDRRTDAAERWDELMWPWSRPHSVADGILDDETYDWLAVFEATQATGGWPVVASEDLVIEAHSLGSQGTGIDASATGTAGLAGLLAMRDDVAPTENVAVIFSGVAR